MKIKDDYQAFLQALKLAVSAPTDEKSNQALELALSFSKKLSEVEIERAKKEAESNPDI
tara:strand:+ start:891 stop:1067 length:177 start_codon:yes stop_codon:yes gene_type:complete